MNLAKLKSKLGDIRDTAFKGTVPSDYRPKGAATHLDLFRSIMKIASAIEADVDIHIKEQQIWSGQITNTKEQFDRWDKLKGPTP